MGGCCASLSLSLLTAVVAPSVKPDQRYPHSGLGTRSTWRKEEYKKYSNEQQRQGKYPATSWVPVRDEECCWRRLPCPGLDQSSSICFSYHFAIQTSEGLHHSPCSGDPSLTGATLYWNFPPWLGADPWWKLLPITTPEGSAILLTQAKHDSSPMGLSRRGFAMCS